MIAFGCSISSDEVYRRWAKVGLDCVAEPDSRVLALAKTATIGATYNLILDRAAALPELEALVLIHEDAEITEGEFGAKLRAAFSDPEVAILGCIGAIGVRSIAWWDGALTSSSAPYTVDGLEGAELGWPRDTQPAPSAAGAVDTLYGVVLALSPWAVGNLRFDESLGSMHGYDFDICVQARAAGRKIVAADLRVVHHHALELVADEERFISDHIRVAEKWDATKLTEAQWRARARAAEADAGAARLLAASVQLQADATAGAENRHLDEVRASSSWRLTEPLRVGNALARRRRRLRSGGPPAQRDG